MGTEPYDGADNSQSNESLKNVNERALKLAERAQAERRTDGGQKG